MFDTRMVGIGRTEDLDQSFVRVDRECLIYDQLAHFFPFIDKVQDLPLLCILKYGIILFPFGSQYKGERERDPLVDLCLIHFFGFLCVHQLIYRRDQPRLNKCKRREGFGIDVK